MRYSYTARDQEGKVIRGFIYADSEVSLSQKISEQGYFLTSFKAADETGVQETRSKIAGISAKEVFNFTIHLSTLLDAGVPLLESLKNLGKDAENVRIQNVVNDVRQRVEGGSSLKDALLAHPRAFTSLYVSIVGAGEKTGKLSQVLEDLAALLEWQLDLQAKVKEAATYPVILFVVMIAVVLLLTIVVIPKFEPIFEQVGVDLPIFTVIVMNTSYILRTYWWSLPVVLGALVFLIKVLSRKERGKYLLDTVKLKMPIFGSLIRKIALSRFTHTFSLCFQAGIDLLSVLDIAKNTCGNTRVEKAVATARESVNVGGRLASSLQSTGEFPPMVIRMVDVGEQTGSLGRTLSKVSDFYDKEVAATMKSIFALFEPLMIVVMGVVVGGIAMSIFLPMFKMLQMVG